VSLALLEIRSHVDKENVKTKCCSVLRPTWRRAALCRRCVGAVSAPGVPSLRERRFFMGSSMYKGWYPFILEAYRFEFPQRLARQAGARMAFSPRVSPVPVHERRQHARWCGRKP